MVKAKVVHSDDGCTMIFTGDKKTGAEPSTGIIKFPGGHVEVARTTDGKYWVHVEVDDASNIADSRIDYDYETNQIAGGKIPPIPHAEGIKHMAIKVDGVYSSTATL